MNMEMDMQPRHGQYRHRAGTSSYSMDMDRQHANGHAEWTPNCSVDMDMNIQHGQGHAAWTRVCSMDMDSMDMNV